MNKLLPLYIFCIVLLLPFGCKQKSTASNSTENIESKKRDIVGGPCDGCEIMYVEMPKDINSIDTSAAWYEKGQRLVVNGTVKKQDGITPAKDIIIYYWHTDDRGYYSPSANQIERSKRHGHIRGWVKTDVNGKYFINTIKPAAYPNDSIPAHIHMLIKEPIIEKEYYIDDLVFNGDPFLTKEYITSLTNRGGSGILFTEIKEKNLVTNHTIILGLNIPAYPK